MPRAARVRSDRLVLRLAVAGRSWISSRVICLDTGGLAMLILGTSGGVGGSFGGSSGGVGGSSGGVSGGGGVGGLWVLVTSKAKLSFNVIVLA